MPLLVLQMQCLRCIDDLQNKSQQHQIVNDSSKVYNSNIKTDDISVQCRVHGDNLPHLPLVLTLKAAHAAAHQLQLEYYTVTQLAATVTVAADCVGSITAEATAALETAMAALLFGTPTSLLAVVNLAQVACVVLDRLLLGQDNRAADKADIMCGDSASAGTCYDASYAQPLNSAAAFAETRRLDTVRAEHPSTVWPFQI